MHTAIGTIDRLYTRGTIGTIGPPKLKSWKGSTDDPAMKLVDDYFQIMDKYDGSAANPSGRENDKGTVTQWGKNRGGWTSTELLD